MAITQAQLEARRRHLGSSDAAAVLGLCPWRSPHHVYMDKVHGERQAQNDNMRDGVFLEPAILNWAEWKIGKSFERDVMLIHDNKIMAANFDGMSMTEEFLVEAKWKANQLEGDPPEQCFGRAGSNQIPQNYLVQVHHQLAVAGPEYQIAYVAVLRGWNGLGFGLYRVRRDQELCEIIEQKCVEFWTKHVVPKIPPAKPETKESEHDTGTGEAADAIAGAA